MRTFLNYFSDNKKSLNCELFTSRVRLDVPHYQSVIKEL